MSVKKFKQLKGWNKKSHCRCIFYYYKYKRCLNLVSKFYTMFIDKRVIYVYLLLF